ncbi:MAG: His/Gly/Thr/Pro-type tRNA ligase C-terminal domain-containing protein, partial [Flavobacteriaceae bacterium]|nr:His/Gly/Thr/Pro-type tRNA ligase C-terminal domain-containing protein [Flavobacteriaceae bacterium]
SFLAPVKLAILPLVNKEALVRLAQEINDKLQWEWAISLDVKDTIGKRYRRQDAIGTPYCVTIDFDSLDDGKVTLRNRDSMKQERIAIDRIKQVVAHKVDMISALKTL